MFLAVVGAAYYFKLLVTVWSAANKTRRRPAPRPHPLDPGGGRGGGGGADRLAEHGDPRRRAMAPSATAAK